MRIMWQWTRKGWNWTRLERGSSAIPYRRRHRKSEELWGEFMYTALIGFTGDAKLLTHSQSSSGTQSDFSVLFDTYAWVIRYPWSSIEDGLVRVATQRSSFRFGVAHNCLHQSLSGSNLSSQHRSVPGAQIVSP